MTVQERKNLYGQQFAQADNRVKQLGEELEMAKIIREQLRGKYAAMEEQIQDEQKAAASAAKVTEGGSNGPDASPN